MPTKPPETGYGDIIALHDEIIKKIDSSFTIPDIIYSGITPPPEVVPLIARYKEMVADRILLVKKEMISIRLRNAVLEYRKGLYDEEGNYGDDYEAIVGELRALHGRYDTLLVDLNFLCNWICDYKGYSDFWYVIS